MVQTNNTRSGNGRGDPLRGFEAVVDYLRKMQREEFYGTVMLKFDKAVTLLTQQQAIVPEELTAKEQTQLRSNYDANNRQR